MKVGIVGANGYGGVELIRLLHRHPEVEVTLLISHSTSGQQITDQYPHLQGILHLPLETCDIAEVVKQVDLLFFATPPGVTKEMAPPFVEAGLKCIDLSGDFRLKDPASYEAWYHLTPAAAADIKKATYGLTELYRDNIKEKTFISNPGCYPTAAILGLYPALQHTLVNLNMPIIIDGKTGVSGAGRKSAVTSLFTEVNENMKAYKLANHKHTPEMEQVLSRITKSKVTITFSPHLVPMSRGIMCTTYVSLNKAITENEIIEHYQAIYENEPFVRVRPAGTLPQTKEVTGTNFCDIGLTVDTRTNQLIIVSVVDNLVKGAAGQAIQNMNVINGWKETLGLDLAAVYP